MIIDTAQQILREILKSDNPDNISQAISTLEKNYRQYLDKVKNKQEARSVFIMQVNKEAIETAKEHLAKIQMEKLQKTPVSTEELNELKQQIAEGRYNNFKNSDERKIFFQRLTENQRKELFFFCTGGQILLFKKQEEFKNKKEYEIYNQKRYTIFYLLEAKYGKYPYILSEEYYQREYFKEIYPEKRGKLTQEIQNEWKRFEKELQELLKTKKSKQGAYCFEAINSLIYGIRGSGNRTSELRIYPDNKIEFWLLDLADDAKIDVSDNETAKAVKNLF